MAQKRGTSSGPAVSVQFVAAPEALAQRSRSLTVYGVMVEDLARYAEEAFRRRWTTTSLTDRRHKRR